MSEQQRTELDHWSAEIVAYKKGDVLCEMLADTIDEGIKLSLDHIEYAKEETGCNISLDDVLFKHETLKDTEITEHRTAMETLAGVRGGMIPSDKNAFVYHVDALCQRMRLIAERYDGLVLYSRYKKQ